MLFEPIVLKEILRATCVILLKNFFYDESQVHQFLDDFKIAMTKDLALFEMMADPEVVQELEDSRVLRAYFTTYFVSRHIRELFINKFHFTEQELEAFENVLVR